MTRRNRRIPRHKRKSVNHAGETEVPAADDSEVAAVDDPEVEDPEVGADQENEEENVDSHTPTSEEEPSDSAERPLPAVLVEEAAPEIITEAVVVRAVEPERSKTGAIGRTMGRLVVPIVLLPNAMFCVK